MPDSFTEEFQSNVEEAQEGSQNTTDAEAEAGEGFQESLEESTGGSQNTTQSEADVQADATQSLRDETTSSGAVDAVTDTAEDVAETASDAVADLTGEQPTETGRSGQTEQEFQERRNTSNRAAAERTDAAIRSLRRTGTTSAEARAREGLETLRDTGTTSAEARTAAGLETLRRTGRRSEGPIERAQRRIGDAAGRQQRQFAGEAGDIGESVIPGDDLIGGVGEADTRRFANTVTGAVDRTLEATGGINRPTVVPTSDGLALTGAGGEPAVADQVAADTIRGIGEAPNTAVQVTEAGAFALGRGQEASGQRFTDRARRLAAGAGRVGAGFARSAAENPGRTAGGLGAGFVTGTGATRVVQGVTRGAASAIARRRAAFEVDAEDLARNDPVAPGDNPTFNTDPGAPPFEAVDEFRRRSEANPDVLDEATASEGGTVLRSEGERLPEFLRFREGNFELPGGFTSPDLPRLRDSGGQPSGVGRTKLRLPRPSDFLNTDKPQFSAFPGDRVESIPQSGAESGFVVRNADNEIVERTQSLERAREVEAETPGGSVGPDPDTAGFEFLTEEAEPGTVFTRATGDRTREFEGIFAPGTEFRRQETGIINLPEGGTGRVDAFRRPEDAVFKTSGGLGIVRRGSRADVNLDTSRAARRADRETRSVDSSRRSRSGEAPEGEPVGVSPTGSSRSTTSETQSQRRGPTVGSVGGGSDSPPEPTGNSVIGSSASIGSLSQPGDSSPDPTPPTTSSPGSSDGPSSPPGESPPDSDGSGGSSGGSTGPPSSPPGSPVAPGSTSTSSRLEQQQADTSQFDIERRSDFEKAFTSAVATPETVAFGRTSDLGDASSFSDEVVEIIDADLTPSVVSVSGDVPDADSLLDEVD